MKTQSKYDTKGRLKNPEPINHTTTFVEGKHNYIVVHENGNIKTEAFEKPVTYEYMQSVGHLNGHHVLLNKTMIFWSDEGSVNGMKRNAPVSNYLGFTAYGPVMFCQYTTLSAGLKRKQFEEILSGLTNAKDPSPENIDALVMGNLNFLDPIGSREYAELDKATFVQNINVTHGLYGFIRQIASASKRKRYIARLNEIRSQMRAGARMRTDVSIIIMYSSEEVAA
jgi:hypothetical protein